MKSIARGIRVTTVITILFAILGCDAAARRHELAVNSKKRIAEDGIALIGGFRFGSGDGDLSAVYNSDNYEVVPLGAVLVVVKRAYCIGYSDYGAYYIEQTRKVVLSKVFFIIYPNGKIEFYFPDATDARFFGDRIPGAVSFERIQSAQAGFDPAGRSGK